MPMPENKHQALISMWYGAKASVQDPYVHREIICQWHSKLKISASSQKTVLEQDAEAVTKFLLDGSEIPPGLFQKYRKAFFFGPDRKLLNAFQASLEERLNHIWQMIQMHEQSGDASDPDRILHWKLQISQLLSYMTYTERLDGDIIHIPYYCEESHTWRLIEYKIDRLCLTPKWLGSPYYAYGLTSTDTKAPSLLLFMGTTYPGGNGFLWTLMADTFPFASVGSLVFQLGKKQLRRWVTAQKAQNKTIESHGQSLGGALSMLAADYFKSSNLQSYAVVPAGTRKPLRQAHNIRVIFGGRDPVCMVGEMPEGAEFFYILPAATRNGSKLPHFAATPGVRGILYSHTAGLCCHEDARIFKVGREMIAKRPGKTRWNLLWYASWVIAPILWVCRFALAALMLLTTAIVLAAKYAYKHIVPGSQDGGSSPSPSSSPEPSKTIAPLETVVIVEPTKSASMPEESQSLTPSTKKKPG